MNDEVKLGREAIGALTDLVKAAGENAHAREAAQNLGQAAVTITKTINTALLPLAAVNFAFDKARNYFSRNFERDLLDRTKDIPLENVVDPKASVAGPALQGIAFSHDEPNLKAMYLGLIATAMDGRIAETAHPAFVEIIKQLEGEEARLLGSLLRNQGALPIVQMRVKTVGQPGHRTIGTHLMDLRDMETMRCVENPNQPAMVDNWLRLGLIEVRYDQWLIGDTAYSWVEERPEYQRAKLQHEVDAEMVSFQRGLIGRTAFGLKFGVAVGLLANNPVPLELPATPNEG